MRPCPMPRSNVPFFPELRSAIQQPFEFGTPLGVAVLHRRKKRRRPPPGAADACGDLALEAHASAWQRRHATPSRYVLGESNSMTF